MGRIEPAAEANLDQLWHSRLVGEGGAAEDLADKLSMAQLVWLQLNGNITAFLADVPAKRKVVVRFEDGAARFPVGRLALLSTLAFGLCLAGELLERYLFFAAAPASKMPGGIA